MEEKRTRLLIVSVNWIGDVIFSTPFIRAVRNLYPDGYIVCLLHPRCREVLEANPRLDEIIIYDEEGVHRGLFGKIRLIMELRKKHFDVAFILHRSFTKALIAFLSGIKERVGYPTKNRAMLLTKIVEEPVDGKHKVEYFLNIARAAGARPKDVAYEFFVREEDRRSIRQFLSENGIAESDRVVVMCPGGNWDPKRWPKENFAKLGDMLSEKLGAKIVVSGAAKDMNLASAIKDMMKKKPVISCGRTTLKELGALLERADLVIANDTGPMHLAVAVRSKVIALFGPTSPEITGPYGSGNYRVISKNDSCTIPCYDFSCKNNDCMASIKVEDVFDEVRKILTT